MEVTRRSLATHLVGGKNAQHWLAFRVPIFTNAALHIPLRAATPLISGFQTIIIIIIQALGWEMKSIMSC